MDKTEQDELLSQCRYYKGEEDFPEKLVNKIRGHLFWNAERLWVKSNDKRDMGLLKFLCDCDLSDERMWLNGTPKEIADIPINLRAIMFSLYCSHSDIDPIQLSKRFEEILREYLAD